MSLLIVLFLSLTSTWAEVRSPVLIVGIGGPSCAGKTELAARIERYVNSDDLVVISTDWYFKDWADLPKEHYVDGQPNGDHPSAVDFDRLVSDVRRLAGGERIQIPGWDYEKDRRIAEADFRGPARVVIVEGLHAFWNPRLRALFDYGLFVTAEADVRLARRLVRDRADRKKTPEQTLEDYFKIVRPMQELFVDPTVLFADRRVEEADLPSTALDLAAEILRFLRRSPRGDANFFFDREVGFGKRARGDVRGESIQQVLLEQGAKARLFVGGSLRPPTLDHVGLMIGAMGRFGFTRGSFLPSNSYKPGSINNAAALHLSRIQVESFNEALDASAVDYSNFTYRPQTGARWKGADGREYRVQVDSTEIDIADPVVDGEDRRSLIAFERLRDASGGDPRSIFWMAGGDSFVAMPKWNSVGVKHLDFAHWIVVTRPEHEGRENNVSFEAHDPIRNHLPAEIVANYTYYFDHHAQTHVYENKNPELPNIYVIRLAKNGVISSTTVRGGLDGSIDPVVARAGTTPAVYAACLTHGFFKSAAGCAEPLTTFPGEPKCKP